MVAPVILQEYDPKWLITFDEIHQRLSCALQGIGVGIEHVGSTSVPGLLSKPIIDIDIGAEDDIAVEQAIGRLVALGYQSEGELGIAGRHALRASIEMPHHHLYVCRMDNKEFRRHLAFRNYLREHPDAMNAYRMIKKAAAETFRNDRTAYTDAKSAFIESVLLRCPSLSELQ